MPNITFWLKISHGNLWHKENKVFDEMRCVTESISYPDCLKLKIQIMAEKTHNGSYHLGVKFFLLSSTEPVYPFREGSQTSLPHCISLKIHWCFTKAVFYLFPLFFSFTWKIVVFWISFWSILQGLDSESIKSPSAVLAKTNSNFDMCLCDWG